MNLNTNGTNDVGIMQLNSQYFNHIDRHNPEHNIRAAVTHIRYLIEHPWTHTWWDVAIAYNAGLGRLTDPPASTLVYAAKVMQLYTALNGGYARAIPVRTKAGGWE